MKRKMLDGGVSLFFTFNFDKVSKLRTLFLLPVYFVLFSCSESTSVFVSPAGNDKNSGTLEKPFLTIQKALDVVREKRMSGNNVPFNIVLREGDYYFAETLEFADSDSNLIIAPYNGEKVRFTGGISVEPEKAVSVLGTDKEKYFSRESREHICMVHLKKLGITDYGELHPFGFLRPEKPSWMEVFINGEPYHLSRWPNDSSIQIGEVINSGAVEAEKNNGEEGGTFKYSVERPSKWRYSEDIWIFGYFNYGWADDAVKLATIDTTEKTFTTVQSHIYGFSSGKPWNSWYAFNLIEEVDTVGEYYVDRKEGILYFYSPEETETIEVSVFKDPFLSMKRASSITVKGITFDCARWSAVEMSGTQNCLFSNCTFKNLGGYAVNIENDKSGALNGEKTVTGKNNGIDNCSVFQTGLGGIRLGGGNRETLEGSGDYVSNCTIHNFNRIANTYCPGIRIYGVGNRISNNEIFDAPHAAILLKGNDHQIEYNEIHDVCLTTDDVGALYYGRNPSERGNVARFNYFHHLGNKYRTTAVYHDDGACGMKVYGNVFYKAGTIPSLIGGGSDNMYTNNIFIDCPIGIKVDNRMQAYDWAIPMIEKGGVIDQRLSKINYNRPPYSEKYPRLAKYWDDNPALPKRNKIDQNVFVDVNEIIRGDKKFLDFTERNYITTDDPGFVDKENQNFKLKSSSVIFEKIPGFEQIPFEQIGVTKMN
ncbi:Right handed beta helix region [Mariniphaga anaerophila]|uniref:Right handed beta helix region n=1 Tax=Mariniphaga anaerophila TaxID=1484053 RepID=A0A1M5G1Z4_9BACT|nr:right-handed parallel beta-helix repeat-containing protein [Mariniphaga anaerophila]SHF97743.1 Right handed beta helix region [Mariniphaga anaerophila]